MDYSARSDLGGLGRTHLAGRELAGKGHRERSVGPWAEQKLDALEQYLNAYMLVMKNQRFKLFYVDAFAGAGVLRVRPRNEGETAVQDLLIPDLNDDDANQVEKYINGSPLRALGLVRKFHHYRFVDIDPDRASELERLAAARQVTGVRVILGEANEVVQDIAAKFTRPDWRGVAFLDPYGAHLHWATLEALAKTGKFDVIINFPLAMAINRLVKRDGDIRLSWQQQLDMCFGCEDWRTISRGTASDLFGLLNFKREDASEQLLSLYVQRLKETFGHVSAPRLVRNTRGSPLYYLIWASSNGRGKEIANHILRLGERVQLGKMRQIRSIG